MKGTIEDTTTFGGRLRRERSRLGLTLGEMASRVGISKTYLWELEGGGLKDQPTPGADVLSRLADATGTTMDALWRDDAPPDPAATLRRAALALESIAREAGINPGDEPKGGG